MRDDKYVVFKREDVIPVEQMPGRVLLEYRVKVDEALDDAVVIRTQDLFAASGLYAYAHTIYTHIHLIETRDGLTREDLARLDRLREIADYFFDRAREAEETVGKIPD